MNGQLPFREFSMDAETAIREITRCLAAAGLTVKKTFDLRSACAPFSEAVCPHHAPDPCDCQLAVLLVYGAGAMPASLVLHSHRGRTELFMEDAFEDGGRLIAAALED